MTPDTTPSNTTQVTNMHVYMMRILLYNKCIQQLRVQLFTFYGQRLQTLIMSDHVLDR